MAIESDIVTLTGTVNTKTAQINIQKAEFALAKSNAGLDTTASFANRTLVTNANTAATNSATAASTSSAGATAQKNLAVTAWTALRSPVETLPAVSATIHSGVVVQSIIYDTSKDSDGGAWRKRCTGTSWFNEPIVGGKWLGQAATAAAGWALSGAVTGDYFQNTTDGRFYILGASSPAVSETFRGNTREFPEMVAVVAGTDRIVVYDLTQPNAPMWRSVMRPSSSTYPFWWKHPTDQVATSVAAINGSIYLGITNGGDPQSGLVWIDFIGDRLGKRKDSAAEQGYLQRVSSTMLTNIPAITPVAAWSSTFLDQRINSVSVAIRNNAPIDPVTGLPTPTIYVSTNNGVSVVRDDGVTVTNIATSRKCFGVEIDQNVLRVTTEDGTQTGGTGIGNPVLNFYDATTLAALSPAYINNTSSPSTGFSGWDSTVKLAGSAATHGAGNIKDNRLTRFKYSPDSLAKSAAAYITRDFNTGWQFGDIRGTYLADTVAETLTAPELVTDGSFTSTGPGIALCPDFTAFGTGAISSGVYTVSATSGTAIRTAFSVSGLVVGKTYTYTARVTAISGGLSSLVLAVSTNNNLYTALATSANIGSPGMASVAFVATSSFLYFGLTESHVGAASFSVDDVSVKLAEADRSVKSNPLSISGTLTKTAVAAGANLVTYSGFSAANYLDQPYSANMNFGTGEWNVSAWVNTAGWGPHNLLTWSQDFTNAGAYSASTVTRTPGQSNTYTGGTDATLLTCAAVPFGCFVRTAYSYAASTPYTLAVIAKASGANFIGLRVSAQSASASDNYCYFDLTTGAGTAITPQLGVINSLTSVALAGGYYLCCLAYTTGASPAVTTDIAITTNTGATNRTPSITETVLIHRAGLFNGTLTAAQILAQGGIALTAGSAFNGLAPFVERSNPRNLLTWSQDLNNAAWNKTNVTATSTTLVRSSASSAFAQSAAFNIPVGASATVAVLAKPKAVGGALGVRLTGAYPHRVDAVFNLLTGTITGSAANTFTNQVATIVGPDGNGNYLCALSGVVGGSPAVNLIIGPCETTASIGSWESGSAVLSDLNIAASGTFLGTWTAQQILAQGGIPLTTTTATAAGPSIQMGLTGDGKLQAIAFDGTTTRTVTSTSAYNTGIPVLASATYRTTGDLVLTVNEATATTTGAALLTMNNASATLTVGADRVRQFPFPGSLSLLRIGATAPSADQLSFQYRTELPLFQAGAQCTIAGTGTSMGGIAYDESTDLLHVSSTNTRTSFKNLLRVGSEATGVGNITSLSAVNGVVLTGGTNARVAIPQVNIRQDLRAKNEAGRAADKTRVYFDYDAVTSQTKFLLPKGYTTKEVFVAGVAKRPGATKDYTLSTDGFTETITFNTAPGNTVWVSVAAVRT